MPDALDAFCRAIPKAELHVHLLGTIRPDTFVALARAAGASVDEPAIRAFYVRGEKPKGVLHVFRLLEREVLLRPDDLARLAREYAADAAAHGVRYAEVFWNPTGSEAAIGYARGQDAILEGFRDAEAAHGVVCRLVPAIDREAPPAAALEMIGLMAAHRREETIGLGIDYRETEGPPERFAEAYRLAARHGFRRTAHAGEFGCAWTNVRIAIDELGVERIDHGYTAIDDAAFARRCAESGIVFTVVPTNSYYLRTLPRERWSLDHPIRRMPGAGLRIHPNTDDPTLHGVTPTGAWRMMVDAFGFAPDDLRGFMLNGLDGAWIDAGTRRAWARDWAAAFDMSRAALPRPVG
jgi:adenosine deaminase